MTRAQVQNRLNAVDKLISEAAVLLAEIGDEMEGYYDERSEGWQEGEAGQEYADLLGRVRDDMQGPCEELQAVIQQDL